ncbi:MAG: hypothetical protein ACOC2F_00390 [Bacteroidota bacterium]
MANVKEIPLIFNDEMSIDFSDSLLKVPSILEKILFKIDQTNYNILPFSYKDPLEIDSEACILMFFITEEQIANTDFLHYIKQTHENLSSEREIIFLTSSSFETESINKSISTPEVYPVFKHTGKLVPDYTALVNIAYRIKNCFSRPPEHSVKGNVYLAETSTDQQIAYESIRGELELAGYKVLPDKPLPARLDDFMETMRQYLSRCFCSIHFIGNQYGRVIKESGESVVSLQNKIAADFYRDGKSRNFHRLISIPVHLVPEDEKQREFVDYIMRDREELAGAELIQAPLEMFKSLVTSKINQFVTGASDESQSFIYFLYDKDSNEINMMRKSLKTGNIPFLEIQPADPANAFRKHISSLMECDGVIIHYSGTSEKWLESKIKDVIKAPGFGRKKPFICKVISFGEHQDVNSKIEIPEDFVTINGEGFKFENLLNPIKEKLKPK